jgi:hypothetical protein
MIRRTLVCLALCWGTFSAAAAEAQQAYYPSWSGELETYMQQTAVIGGRIVNPTWRGDGMGTMTSMSQGPSLKEEMRVQSVNGALEIHYERTDAKGSLLLEAASNGRFSIRREGKGKAAPPPLQFDQPVAGPISLRLGQAGSEKTYRAASLWHLAIVQPEACRQLFPLLAPLPGCTQLSQNAAAIEAELLRAAADKPPDDRKLSDLVRQLGDSQFAKREAADRRLRAGGPAVLGYLQHLDFAQLDAEQQFRVQRILGSFLSSADTPAQAAARLAGDSSIWLALLGRPEAATRRTAAKQLAKLLGRPIGVDPEADPATQAGQREQLRAKIEPPAAETKAAPKP